jgi:nucleoside-diphosphate-sugar epimerase
MRVFVTGATGFIGSAIVGMLLEAGHEVLGLARSDAAAASLAERGVAVRRGDLTDPAGLAAAALACDGVIHTAFIHDFSQYVANGETDLRAVEAMTEALAGSGKPLVNTSGMTMLATPGHLGAENDPAVSEGFGAVRGRSENAAIAAAQRGVRTSVVRLAPSVHDRAQQGLVTQLAQIARQKGVSAYVGDGANRWPAVHRLDAARLFCLALERAAPGVRLHGVAEEGVPLRAIAEAVGAALALPVRSIAPEAAFEHFGWLGPIVMGDITASSAVTRESLGWTPREPGLLAGLRSGGYVL